MTNLVQDTKKTNQVTKKMTQAQLLKFSLPNLQDSSKSKIQLSNKIASQL